MPAIDLHARTTSDYVDAFDAVLAHDVGAPAAHESTDPQRAHRLRQRAAAPVREPVGALRIADPMPAPAVAVAAQVALDPVTRPSLGDVLCRVVRLDRSSRLSRDVTRRVVAHEAQTRACRQAPGPNDVASTFARIAGLPTVCRATSPPIEDPQHGPRESAGSRQSAPSRRRVVPVGAQSFHLPASIDGTASHPRHHPAAL